MGMKSALLLCAAFTAGAACAGSVLDIFPDTGVATEPGTGSCSFEYVPSGSDWTEGVDEKAVFLASIQGDGWRMGIGRGGQIYSLRGPYGESVPPQRQASPWNDEVWQSVVTNEELIGPIQDYQNANRKKDWEKVWNATFPLMYFVHQAGIYTKGAGTDGGAVPAPFYSPCLRRRWNAETRTLEMVNWMQQARTPCVWKSGVLIYTAYRDVGSGVIEVNQVLHNFGAEVLTFQNTPWGGVRHSSLPQAVMSDAGGSWKAVDGVYGWTDIPTRSLVATGGWMAWTRDHKRKDSPSLALVFGTDSNDVSRGKRHDEAIRWGNAGNDKVRDYEVAERMSHAHVEPGDSWSIRWYLVSGEFAQVHQQAKHLSGKAGISELRLDCAVKQPVWMDGAEVRTGGEGKPAFELCAFPARGTVPVFLLKDKRTGKTLITTDIYSLAETEPYPNPLPEDLPFRGVYNDRVIYRQYAPHIGYENLLGYAYTQKPAGVNSRKLALPVGSPVLLEEDLWIPAGSAADIERPNIIFIFADDWGYGDLGIHGSTFCKTPRIDRMAAEGIDFQNFTVNHPVCSPSRTAVITGQFPARHSVHGHFASMESHVKRSMPDWLDPQAPMLPRMLKAGGYATAHFGKWHLCNDHIPDGPAPTAYGYDEFGAFNLPTEAGEQMPTAETCPRAVDFIRRHKDRPFFINLWLHETHTPHYPQEKYLKQFETLDEQQKVYAAIVAEGDAAVGSILDTLAELGLDERTLVIFSSDNGPEWTGTKKHTDDTSTGPGLGTYYSVGETGGLKGQKRSLYAGGIRVPFIARWPGTVPAGRTDRSSVITAVDLLPTFMELAGLPLPEDYAPDGASMVSALKGDAFDRGKPIFWEWRPARDHPETWPHLGIRDGPWKLMINQQLGRAELYHIRDDWAESADLAASRPEVVRQLTQQLARWEKTLPVKPPPTCMSRLRRDR
jgi:N-acetylgalactosamine-6-sulfatase